ncbi:SCO family protein [Marinobacter sp. CHS3-4]|uniref:SCO family protein n=1 Tax=Marinobacter sp. CHS3-4 TaxID=3045174 RepID=UPI0024B601C6|nr:SCO family protein [Marinobacter sp. CHS3-4]MDI9245289.1 SCO family protein [Marinobacter sp. CHS3-4]
MNIPATVQNRFIWVLSLMILIAGCSNSDRNWNAKDISGLMPELEYELINASGEPVTAEANAGAVRLMFFGFTSCPDICPTTLQKLSRVVKELPDEAKKNVEILFVSVDPKRDTPERIKNYVEFFGDRITGLTGPEKNLRQLSKRYRTTFGYEDPDEKGNYAVSHSGAVYVFDRQGRARLLVRPEQSVDEIREDILALATGRA